MSKPGWSLWPKKEKRKKTSRTIGWTEFFCRMKPFNLHSPVNQSIIFQIFPKQNILNLRGLPLIKIRVSDIGEDGFTDSTACGKKSTALSRRPRSPNPRWLLMIQQRQQDSWHQAYVLSDPAMLCILWAVWGLGPKPGRALSFFRVRKHTKKMIKSRIMPCTSLWNWGSNTGTCSL